MDKLELVVKSIDWVFALVILIGGRYFGSKYFRLTKHDPLNFLGFATFFAGVWLLIKYYTMGIPKAEVGNLFITYLVTTSFYELAAKMFFEWLEVKLGIRNKQEPVQQITIEKGKGVVAIEEVIPEQEKKE